MSKCKEYKKRKIRENVASAVKCVKLPVHVRCLNQLHSITMTEDGRLISLNHRNREEVEADIAISVLAKKKPFRCLRVFKAWRNAKTQADNYWHIARHRELPDELYKLRSKLQYSTRKPPVKYQYGQRPISYCDYYNKLFKEDLLQTACYKRFVEQTLPIVVPKHHYQYYKFKVQVIGPGPKANTDSVFVYNNPLIRFNGSSMNSTDCEIDIHINPRWITSVYNKNLHILDGYMNLGIYTKTTIVTQLGTTELMCIYTLYKNELTSLVNVSRCRRANFQKTNNGSWKFKEWTY